MKLKKKLYNAIKLLCALTYRKKEKMPKSAFLMLSPQICKNILAQKHLILHLPVLLNLTKSIGKILTYKINNMLKD